MDQDVVDHVSVEVGTPFPLGRAGRDATCRFCPKL